MSIAVIIPAYNAEAYITRCIESCILQRELSEIIIIDDGSSDDTCGLVSGLQRADKRIRLLRHKDGVHLGRSATRNLGIIEAQSEWITFCDADDYYLEDRFKAFKSTDTSYVDGIYEAVHSHYEDPGLKSTINAITRLTSHVDSADLQDYLIRHSEERISIIGLIVRKSVLDQVGLFDTDLEVGEDTDLIWRLAGASQLIGIPSSASVVIRSVHPGNTFQKHNQRYRDQMKYYTKWKSLIPTLNVSAIAKTRITHAERYYRYRVACEQSPLILRPLVSLKYHVQRAVSKL